MRKLYSIWRLIDRIGCMNLQIYILKDACPLEIMINILRGSEYCAINQIWIDWNGWILLRFFAQKRSSKKSSFFAFEARFFSYYYHHQKSIIYNHIFISCSFDFKTALLINLYSFLFRVILRFSTTCCTDRHLRRALNRSRWLLAIRCWLFTLGENIIVIIIINFRLVFL